MLSLLLIAALAVQNPPASSKPATDTAAQKRPTSAAPRGNQSAVSRQAFHDRMRELWADHIVYTRSLIVSASAGLADTAEVLQRLLRNQDEMGDAITPYYGDENGTRLASLLRSHIQHAGKALVAAKGEQTPQVGMNQDVSSQYISNRMGDTISSRADTTRINSQNPDAQARMGDTTSKRQPPSGVRNPSDTARDRGNPAYPNPTQRAADTTKNKQPNARVTGDTMAVRLPSNQYARPDSIAQNPNYAQNQPGQAQAGRVDSTQLNQAIAALRANGDSIATFLAQANPRGFSRESLRSGFRMHIDLLLKEVTAHLKKDWTGSIAATDESLRQALQMADMLSEGIMKQFPNRFSNRTTTVSSR